MPMPRDAMRHRYHLLDVFTDRVFGGNPPAVFIDGAAVPKPGCGRSPGS
ncbi:MAG: hypothetical protein ACRDU8_04005 [Egibacteraceae bacterium]